MDPAVEVVDQQEVDPVDSEALQAVLERPHHAVVAVVEHGLELETADPLSPIERAGLRGPPQEPSDLGRQHVVLPRTPVERAAEPVLGLAAAVPGRGVEIARPAVPGRLDQFRRLGVVDLVEQVAERRCSQSDLAQRRPRPPKLAEPDGAPAHSSGSVSNRSG